MAHISLDHGVIPALHLRMKLIGEELAHVRAAADQGQALAAIILSRSGEFGLGCLTPFCAHGGWPDRPEYLLESVEQHGNAVTIRCAAHFQEVYAAACCEDANREAAQGKVEIRVDLTTGTVECRASHDVW